MLTQCPNPKCKFQFDVPQEREGKNGPCPSCGQVITFRSLAIIAEIERQHQRRAATQPNSGDPFEKLPPFSALLEDLRSLWNVGSIFRSADGAGFGALFLCGITGCPPNKAIAKTSLGAEDHIRWSHHKHALDVIPELKKRGIQIIAIEKTETSIGLESALARKLIKPPLCIIVGNEVAGVTAETLSQADITCDLPMRGIKTSLNVAVAFGIATYAIRQNVATTSEGFSA